MRFEEVDIAEADDFVKEVRSVAIGHHSEGPGQIFLPMMLYPDADEYNVLFAEELGLPFGNDEPTSVNIEFPNHENVVARYTFIGKIAALEPQISKIISGDTEREELLKAFEAWSGEWGGFLKACVTIKNFDGSVQESTQAEIAFMETEAEFKEYGQTVAMFFLNLL